jgi:hypothetical protein
MTFGSRAWPTADLAVYSPLTIHHPVLARKLFWVSGTVVAGNVDIGLYDAGARRLASSGSTLVVGTSALQTYDLSPDLVLAPGTYYLAMVFSSITCQLYGAALGSLTESGRLLGQFQEAAALPLPATAAPASMVATSYLYHVGVVTRVGG